MYCHNTNLPGVLLLRPDYFEDSRGWSTEAYSAHTLAQVGLHDHFVVDYVCLSTRPHTLRGIHIQNNPHAQTKLVRVISGAVDDFVIDLRPDSPHYLSCHRAVLSAENRLQIYIPQGFGHAYLTLEPDTLVEYKFSDYYNKQYVRSVRYDDPKCVLPWEFDGVPPILSEQDAQAPLLTDCDLNLNCRDNPS